LRKLNVVLAPESPAHRAVKPPRPQRSALAPSENLAEGFEPQPGWNLKDEGGPTIADLVFVNRYVGPAEAWEPEDMASIDRALAGAMSDPGLQSVIAQYYNGAQITSTMLPSATHEAPLPETVYKDTAEQLATTLHAEGALGEADPASSVINVMLPKGTVLSDELSPGFVPPAGGEEAAAKRRAGTIRLLGDDDAADSKNGLGGYHGSVHIDGGTEIYYAVGVYSEGENGIAAFDQPWKNVVATFYHELNEARTDPDVEDVNAGRAGAQLGWYSEEHGEIGDIPINACNGNLGLVFKEVALADGSKAPIQLMWSNLADGPAAKA
jgi:hypothetical protein